MSVLPLPALPLASIVLSFNQSTSSGKMIVLILFASSIGAWTVMITKFVQLSRARAASVRFLRAFRHEPDPAGLYLRRERMPETPLNTLYEAACGALGRELGPAGGSAADGFPDAQPLAAHQIESIRAVLDRTLADEALRLEDRMGLLATAVSACPFLGLLGTVWGVMDSFGGMAISGAATLAAVAPGISGALLTTVIGLLVALPSSIGYNMLTSRIRYLAVQMDNFSQELLAALQQRFSAAGE